MQNNIRNAAHLISLTILLGMLSACAFIRINDPAFNKDTDKVGCEDTTAYTDNDTADTKDASADPQNEAKNTLAALRACDFGESTLLIATTDTSHAFSQNQGASLLRNETVYAERMERISWVEEKYNVRIITFTYTENELFDEITKAYKSDTQYVSDYYAIPASLLGRFEANGFLMNLRTLPFTDYTQPYFDAAAMNEMSAGYGIYGAVGDFTRAYDGIDAIYFNRDLTEADLYQAVEEGAWTWELYFAYAKEATSKENGISGDNFSLLSQAEIEARMWGTANLRAIEAGLDKEPTLSSVIPDTVQTMADLLFENVYKGKTSLTLSKNEANDGGKARFASGASLFYHGDLSQMYDWANISVNWGILPLPKLSQDQKYYKNYAKDSAVLCVPETTVESDKTGTVLQALFASSYGAYKDTFLSDALAYHIRDEKTADMLDIITSGTSFDFAAMFASGYPEIASATINILHDAVHTENDAEALFSKAQNAATKLLSSTFPADR